MILAKLDCTYDFSCCALVCRQWLDIINNHQSIETSVVYSCDTTPLDQCLRRFKNIWFKKLSSLVLPATTIEVLCSRAKNVNFYLCEFPSLGAMKEWILACGDLSRLKIRLPQIENLPLMMENNVENVAKSPNQKIGTLNLTYFNSEKEWNTWNIILKMFHDFKALIEVANIELLIYNDDHDDFGPTFDFLKEHFQDKISKLDICEENEQMMCTFLRGFPNLKLKKFATVGNLDEDSVCDFIRRQPTITDLEINPANFDVWECALQHLPLLNVLKSDCFSLDEFNVINESVHRFRHLIYLKLCHPMGPEDSAEYDFNFITKLPNLQRFHCSFSKQPFPVTFGHIINPMLKMKEFKLTCNYDKNSVSEENVPMDKQSMWNIFHQMPNLEQLTVHGETTEVGIIFTAF
jgi:hypothetical protein